MKAKQFNFAILAAKPFPLCMTACKQPFETYALMSQAHRSQTIYLHLNLNSVGKF